MVRHFTRRKLKCGGAYATPGADKIAQDLIPSVVHAYVKSIRTVFIIGTPRQSTCPRLADQPPHQVYRSESSRLDSRS